MVHLRIFITAVMTGILFTSCKKDDTAPEVSSFDINHPEGYYIYLKAVDPDGTNPRVILLQFMDGNRFTSSQVLKQSGVGVFSQSEVPYTLIDANTIAIGELEIKFDRDKISAINGTKWEEYMLIKNPDTNPFTEKLFTGKYFQSSGDVLHTQFFYHFHNTEKKLDAGFTPPTSTRTNTYQLIGNVATLSKPPSTNSNEKDIEFIIKVNNTLRTQYYDNTAGQRFYGEFVQQ